MFAWTDCRIFVVGFWLAASLGGCFANFYENEGDSSSEWVVRVPGGRRVAQDLARDLGYLYRGPVLGFSDTYVLVRLNLQEQHKRGVHYMTRQLNNDHRVLWAEQQENKLRQKRDFLPIVPNRLSFNDELWNEEWYLQDTRMLTYLPKIDLNVLSVFEMGFTGRGIRVSILDDGLEYTHDDLKDNYDPEISWDCNEDDKDPLPHYNDPIHNGHGTRCAGEVAMVANNKKCGVGVAYNAKIGGVKLLGGTVNDRIEGIALSYAYDLVDIYSASWGPNDDGRTVDGPARLALEAFELGINKGRHGKGAIYIWASGNGGSNGDNCNCDGYTGSPYTISIGSASQSGGFPWYGEACASTLAVTYSSGAYNDQKIATTDLNNKCTIKHTGTSASAPLAAGIVALALEANGNLTWRDVQHLIVWTSDFAPVFDNLGWQQNAAGLWVNTRFGFGLMNAYRLVTTALSWVNVGLRSICIEKNDNFLNQTFHHGEVVQIYFETQGCFGTRDEINFLEHVEVEVNVEYSVRGALEIFLESAAGTKIQLLNPRILDTSPNGFQNWKFLSVMTWGEQPVGLWTLQIIDRVGSRKNKGFLGSFKLFLHGTKHSPVHMQRHLRNI